VDRRRLASFAAIGVAAFATLATTSTPPPPPETDKTTVVAALALSPQAPAAVQLLHLHLDGVDMTKNVPPTVLFVPSVLPESAATGDVLLSIVSTAQTQTPDGLKAFRSTAEPQDVPPSLPLACTGSSCDGQFALVGSWADPASKASATIKAQVDATVQLWGGIAAGRPTVSLTTEDQPGDVKPHQNRATASGDVTRLDVRHRLAQWQISMRLGDGPLKVAPHWPLVATARLAPTSTVVTSPDPAIGGVPFAFIEGAGDVNNVGIDTSHVNESIYFEPFWSCVEGEKCIADYVAGLTFPDGRPDSSIDAAWDLDVRVVGADGSDVPVVVEVKPIPPMPMAVGTSSGSIVWNAANPQANFVYHIDIPASAANDDTWDGLRRPNYGIWKATMRSTGSTPLPAGYPVNFGGFGSGGADYRIVLGEEGSFGFVPGYSTCRVGGFCNFEGSLAAGFEPRNLPSGWEMTIDWELEIGYGTTDAGGSLSIVPGPRPSPSP
jgi:hypothetical protein